MNKQRITRRSYPDYKSTLGSNTRYRLFIGALVTLLGLGLLTVYPGVWAAPSRNPTCQTVPPRRPVPPGGGESGSPEEGGSVRPLEPKDESLQFLTRMPAPALTPAETKTPSDDGFSEAIEAIPMADTATSQGTQTQPDNIDNTMQPFFTPFPTAIRDSKQATGILPIGENRNSLPTTTPSLVSEYFILPLGSVLMLAAGFYLLIGSRSRF